MIAGLSWWALIGNVLESGEYRLVYGDNEDGRHAEEGGSYQLLRELGQRCVVAYGHNVTVSSCRLRSFTFFSPPYTGAYAPARTRMRGRAWS